MNQQNLSHSTSSPLCIISDTFIGNVQEPDWCLLDPEEASQSRIFERYVRFGKRFVKKPLVYLSLVGFDIDNSDNARLSLKATNVSVEGFSIQMITWLHTRMWSVEVNWIAFGHLE
jgi:hypothetical protein